MAFSLKCVPVKWVRISQFFKPTHKGIDLAAPEGTTIVAPADGTVVCASKDGKGWDWSYGKEVAIYHGNGIYTNYGHCSKVCCKIGDKVNAGDKIAEVGNTGRSFGNHLHFEVHLGKWNRVDPEPYLDTAGIDFNYRVKTKGGKLNVRKKASKDSEKVGTLKNKTNLHVVKFSGKWAKIDYPKKGYVHSNYIVGLE